MKYGLQKCLAQATPQNASNAPFVPPADHLNI